MGQRRDAPEWIEMPPVGTVWVSVAIPWLLDVRVLAVSIDVLIDQIGHHPVLLDRLTTIAVERVGDSDWTAHVRAINPVPASGRDGGFVLGWTPTDPPIPLSALLKTWEEALGQPVMGLAFCWDICRVRPAPATPLAA